MLCDLEEDSAGNIESEGDLGVESVREAGLEEDSSGIDSHDLDIFEDDSGVVEEEQAKTFHYYHQREGEAVVLISKEEQLFYREHVRTMFYHGYNNYLQHAFPAAELRPIACDGGLFDLVKIPFVTLIDALDTLVIVGDYDEFRRAVTLLVGHLTTFDYDVNVSVFETTIRVLGGLLSAHLLAVDERLNIYVRYFLMSPWLCYGL